MAEEGYGAAARRGILEEKAKEDAAFEAAASVAREIQ